MIIGCAGQMAAGKDLVTNYLLQTLKTWRRFGFADAVKQIFMDSFDVDLEFIETWKRKDEIPDGFDMPVRKSLQFIGDGFRQIQSDVWLKKAIKNSKVIISDCRYINEVKAIRERGYTILIWRKGFENNDPNPSESQIKPFVDWCLETNQDGIIRSNDCPLPEMKYFDYFLRNDGSIQDLYARIDNELLPILNNLLRSLK